MKKKQIIGMMLALGVMFMLSAHWAGAQNRCVEKELSFQSGEEIDYVITYNWFLVWTDVGKVKFEVRDTTMYDRNLYQLIGTGTTFSFYDWFFQVYDVYQSWIDPETFRPVYYHRDVDEDGYLMDIKYWYNHTQNKVYSRVQKRSKPAYRDTLTLPNCTFDVMSVIYYARNIDFEKYEIDQKIPLKIVLDNELTDVYLRYKGKEERKVRGVGRFKTLKFTGSLIAGDVFQGGEDLVIWVSDDENRIPLWIEAPIIVGKIKARLVGYKGLKYPLSSLIESFE